MLFAPSAQHVNTSLAAVKQQLTPSSLPACCMDHDNAKTKANAGSQHKQQMQAKNGLVAAVNPVKAAKNALLLVEQTKVDHKAKPKTEETMEAMRKLDNELLAYLECGTRMSHMQKRFDEFDRFVTDAELQEHEEAFETTSEPEVDGRELFSLMTVMKLHLEALTLSTAGSEKMTLEQNDVRPIFTVECRLSSELINDVPRHDMFHIMQFESEKFSSLTQCTRFGQSTARQVRLKNNNADADNAQPNFGSMHFTVWWREPGTCFNEMLGMGSLQVSDLYNAGTLEQCKCIQINRRGVHMVNLYVKISLYTDDQQLVSTIERRLSGVLPFDVQNLSNLTKQHQKVLQDAGDDEMKNKPQAQEAHNTSRRNSRQDASLTSASIFNAAADSARNNNSFNLVSTNLTSETSKVRLLKGFIYISETRRLEVANYKYFLICRRFWQDAVATKAARIDETETNNFEYLEQFAVINDDKFLSRVERQHLQLEIWRCNTVNSNEISNDCLEPVGIVRLPLHQFFIAYRDEVITNHLCKAKLPVTSVDGWVPVEAYNANATDCAGEIKCLLAVGSEEQISYLRTARSLNNAACNIDMTCTNDKYLSILAKQPILINSAVKLEEQRFKKPTTTSSIAITSNATTSTTAAAAAKDATTSTNNLLNMLQQALTTQQQAQAKPAAKLQNNNEIERDAINSFTIELIIRRAAGFPMSTIPSGKQRKKRNSSDHRGTGIEMPPSTYVTFQAFHVAGENLKKYKSHEGDVYATSIYEKSTHPQWQERFVANIEVDYMSNKHFVLKIWKKSNKDRAVNAAATTAASATEPSPLQDIIVGFVALNCNVFLVGSHIDGWLDVVDFNGRISGQLSVHCRALEPMAELRHRVALKFCPYQGRRPETTAEAATASMPLGSTDAFENMLPDMAHLNLGHALKRKFTELEQISTRLRTRLSDVTGQELSNTPNSNLPLNLDLDASDNDDLWNCTDAETDEFEHDINVTAIEAGLEENVTIAAKPKQ